MLTRIDITEARKQKSEIIEADGFSVLVDPQDYKHLRHYTWKIVEGFFYSYAAREVVRDGKGFLVYMHRQITHARKDEVVHHINFYGLDNRRANLQKMTGKQHHRLHKPADR